MAKTRKKSKHKSAKRPSKRGFVVVFFVLLVLCGVAFWVAYASIFAQTDRNARTLVVGDGDSYQSLLTHWQSHPLSSPWVAKAYLKTQHLPTLQKGSYQLPKGASLAGVLEVFAKGPDTQMIKVQIIEGKTVKDLYHTLKTTDGISLETLSPSTGDYTWADVADDNQKVADRLGIQSPNGNLEGQFAPETYFFAQGATDTAILEKLYQRQQKLLDTAWQGRDENLPYQSPYELLIMASIIERETGVADERPQVSSVFVNRLRRGMRLQTDPTIIYGLFDRYDGTIYRTNIDEKTAYNTYQIDGLPPTPIALPSAAAINAAAHPDGSDYLFFVATGKGGHTFSKTLAEHNQAVAQYRKVTANQ